MLRVGLTGGIACGKTTVARIFGALGCKLINADAVGHEVIRKPQPAHQEILQIFGTEILAPDGEIDRARLGKRVFASPDDLARLNSIVHPRLIERLQYYTNKISEPDPDSILVVEAALIYEVGVESWFEKIVAAWCRPEQQVERLKQDLGLSEEEARQRISSQMPSQEKRRRADYLIDCSGNLDQTRHQVEKLHRTLTGLIRPRRQP